MIGRSIYGFVLIDGSHYVQLIFLSTAQTLTQDSMVATFTEAGVKVPEDWRQISLKLDLDLRGQLSATQFFDKWNQYHSNIKPSWEKLAGALESMDGYYNAARKAIAKARKHDKVAIFLDVPLT